jgi:hypothetical protein
MRRMPSCTLRVPPLKRTENNGFPGATYGRDSGMKTTQEFPMAKGGSRCAPVF